MKRFWNKLPKFNEFNSKLSSVFLWLSGAKWWQQYLKLLPSTSRNGCHKSWDPEASHKLFPKLLIFYPAINHNFTLAMVILFFWLSKKGKGEKKSVIYFYSSILRYAVTIKKNPKNQQQPIKLSVSVWRRKKMIDDKW